MSKKTAIMTSILLCLGAVGLVWAQPPDYAVFPGDDDARFSERRAERLAKMTEYLELSDAQVDQWQEITALHQETMRSRWERIGDLRDEFGALADQEDPNLEQIGQIALDLHREMESGRASREGLLTELETILTPDQSERLEALKTARELGGERRHRGPRDGEGRPRRD